MITCLAKPVGLAMAYFWFCLRYLACKGRSFTLMLQGGFCVNCPCGNQCKRGFIQCLQLHSFCANLARLRAPAAKALRSKTARSAAGYAHASIPPPLKS